MHAGLLPSRKAQNHTGSVQCSGKAETAYSIFTRKGGKGALNRSSDKDIISKGADIYDANSASQTLKTRIIDDEGKESLTGTPYEQEKSTTTSPGHEEGNGTNPPLRAGPNYMPFRDMIADENQLVIHQYHPRPLKETVTEQIPLMKTEALQRILREVKLQSTSPFLEDQ